MPLTGSTFFTVIEPAAAVVLGFTVFDDMGFFRARNTLLLAFVDLGKTLTDKK